MAVEDLTILYVDDEPFNLVTFRATYRRKYKILTAEGGKEGLKILRETKPDIIISDQRMPGMTGAEFLEVAAREYPDTIRIILTGYSDVQAIIEGINNGGIFRYITKPWSETELTMTIENGRQVLNLQRNNRDLIWQLKTKMEEQERTLRLFSRYVPETVVQKSLTGDSIFEGEMAHVAVLFCDIRGFTRMSEKLPPKTVVSILNDYYSIMTQCINKRNGNVCQFVGDEVFGVFGAPLSYSNNEENAVFCAIEMIDSLEKLNDIYRDDINAEIQVGIGVNSGEVVTGNVGSEDFINYTVNGDTVNTGKRIEDLTKDCPNTILISKAVYEKVAELVKVKAWEPLHVKGKKDPIWVFEVLGRKDE